MIRRALSLIVLAVVVVACGDSNADGGSSLSAATFEGPFPMADLSIVVKHPNRDTVKYRLSCLGETAAVVPEGVGVDGQAACLALTKPRVVSRLVRDDSAVTAVVDCAMDRGPDVASISGSIDGQSVDTSVGRRCSFDEWKELFGDVLPPPVGIVID